MLASFALLALGCLATLLAPALAGSPLTQEDNVRIRRMGEYASNTDGSIVFFTYTVYPEGSNSGETRLYLTNANTVLTYSDEEELEKKRTCPELSGISNLVYSAKQGFFLTARGKNGLNSIFRLGRDPLVGYTCTQISDLPVDVDFLKVSPDGSHLAFAAEVFQYDDNSTSISDPLNFAAQEFERIAARPFTAFTYDRLYIRHWDDASSSYPHQWRHLFVCTLESTGTTTITSTNCRDIMAGFEGDAPMKPFADASSYSFSHDGTRIAFVTQLGLDNALQTNDSIYIAHLDRLPSPDNSSADSDEPVVQCLTCWNMARDAQPQWSVDDSRIFYLSMDEPVCESDLPRLRSQGATTYTEVGDAKPSGVRDLTSGTVDFPIDQFVLLTTMAGPDAEAYLVCSDHARETVLKVDLKAQGGLPGKPVRLTYEGSVGSLSSIGGSRFLMLHSSYTHPTELYVLDTSSPLSPEEQEGLGYVFAPDDDVETQICEMHSIVEVNSDVLSGITLQEPEEFYLPMPETNDNVQSWYFPPLVDGPLDSDHKVPLILYIHGGPESPWSSAWSFRWNPQIIAGQGYAVLATNYHGSSSFGLKFSQAIRGEWFSHPVDDVFTAWRYVLQTYPYINGDKVGAMGASFGATFINWLNGHTRNITCFITHDGVFDVYRNALETDELFFPLNEFGGSILVKEDFEKYSRWNPMLHAKNFHTPMLVIHGAHDYRISEYHGIALFNALQVRGVPSKLILFPTQSHWVYKPQESVFWMSEQIKWLAQWLK